MKRVVSINRYLQSLADEDNPLSFPLGDSADLEDTQSRKEQLSKAVKAAVTEELTPRQSELILLYYFENMTMETIAKKLFINKSTVSRTLKAARIRLMRVLKYTDYGRFFKTE